MRSVGSIAALSLLSLLTACGSQPTENATGANAAPPELQSEQSNAVAPTEQAPTVNIATPATGSRPDATGPCLMQVAEKLQVDPIRATGTEPFWAARVEGRCVTYSTPEKQPGVRVWTRYSQGAAGGGPWTGQLDGEKFEMRTRLKTGCSDGMSDKSYPIAVELTVNGEARRGCAEPL
jgi:uncharacterized membrane protein